MSEQAPDFSNDPSVLKIQELLAQQHEIIQTNSRDENGNFAKDIHEKLVELSNEIKKHGMNPPSEN